MRFFLLSCCLLAAQSGFSQKPGLDHSVYDAWQSIGLRQLSNNGKWVVYRINVQEGDNDLVIQSTDGKYKKVIPRGGTARITEDDRFVVFKISPFFKETKDAKVKKKKPEESPKDTLAIIVPGQDSVWKFPRVKSYKMPEKAAGWIAYHLEKENKPDTKAKAGENKKTTDSLRRIIDSLQTIINEKQPKKQRITNRDEENDWAYEDAEGDESSAGTTEAGTTLVLRNLLTGEEKRFNNIIDYYFSSNGSKLLLRQSKDPADSLSQLQVQLYDLKHATLLVLNKGGNDFKSLSISDDGTQVAYLGEREAKPKALLKFYKLWYYRDGMDSARMVADTATAGIPKGHTVSEYSNITFSKSGKRLFFGTAPVPIPKDTTLIDMDLAKLDVWHYNDDYLQTVQLFKLTKDLQINYMAVYDPATQQIKQLETPTMPTVSWTGEGDGNIFVGVTDFGKRIESQWTGTTKKDIYAVNPTTGAAQLVKKDMEGAINQFFASPTGKYIMWYESKAKNYFVWDGKSVRNISSAIKTALYNEDNDMPAEPSPYGLLGWVKGDAAVLLYDKYDIWRIDPAGAQQPVCLTCSAGRKESWSYRVFIRDPENPYLDADKQLLVRRFNERTKESGLAYISLDGKPVKPVQFADTDFSITPFISNEEMNGDKTLLYTKESYTRSPDLYFSVLNSTDKGVKAEEIKLSAINPQQANYNWGTAELYKWKTFTGKPSTGILYKPEDFDSTKKYPLILYFYEQLSDGLNTYSPPTPTGSRINIPFFVSRGYLVFAPDIKYTIGHPAKSAYDYIVSAAKDLAKHKWVDEKNLGIQGQSWGGIQVAQLVTMTNLFKAAWAGAPVANMTSAYGGIRWESGSNRQFQYEKSQSRIGATLWEKPELYIESSPLFHLPKVTTPMVIMANDADGAVPWYQGIELFTAMRRLNKKVWMLNYNGEAHNLVERRNKKDIQIRQQQYFDWLLKGAKPAKWITEGVPAVKKGKDWGLEIVK